jgi:hypothetical protein
MITTHIAGQHVTIDDRYLRQRCAWCGTILLDYDLTLVAVPVGQEGPPATWPVGALVTVDGGASWTICGEQLPDDSCTRTERPSEPTAAQTLRVAVDVIAQATIGCATGDPWLDEAMDQERISFGKVRRALIERAVELERGQP